MSPSPTSHRLYVFGILHAATALAVCAFSENQHPLTNIRRLAQSSAAVAERVVDAWRGARRAVAVAAALPGGRMAGGCGARDAVTVAAAPSVGGGAGAGAGAGARVSGGG